MTVFEMIEEQQKGKEGTPAWTVGEQLKDICREDPVCAQLVAEDLQNQGMGIADCEKKIKEYADKHKTGNFACVIPSVAEDIVRKFYGLPDRKAPGGRNAGVPRTNAGAEKLPVLDIADFF